MNRLFVVKKPQNISSNFYLREVKRRYKVKKAGFSGILDPFASGCLIVAFGQYTKLFNFLKKTPKVYKATLLLGGVSETLDREKLTEVKKVSPFRADEIKNVLEGLEGEIEYLPPKYSAKRINGKKAYQLARNDEDFKLNSIKSTIYDIKILAYNHPFLVFEAIVSEGTYIRSIGEMIATSLGCKGALTSLYRAREGDFIYEDEKSLNPLEYLKTDENFYLGDKFDILLGKKLKAESLKYTKNGVYHLVTEDFLTILSIDEGNVKYLVNKVRLD